MNENRIEKILHFWFGDLPDNETIPIEKAKMWFQDGKKFDNDISVCFSNDLKQAEIDKLDDWQNTPRGCLALIVLLDQFSRNIYRGTDKAFKQDEKALKLAEEGIQKGYHLKLKHIERVFFYMPFEHSEDIAVQRKCLKLFEELANSSPASIELAMANYLDYAKQHFCIIERFNRYPHRNKILNRISTPEEIEFLKQPGSSF